MVNQLETGMDLEKQFAWCLSVGELKTWLSGFLLAKARRRRIYTAEILAQAGGK